MWWNGKAVGFDTETDGPEPTEARIITAGIVRIAPGKRPDDTEVMFQPEREIPAGAIAVHGITTERARDEGQPRQLGIASLVATLAEILGPDVPMVGHNLAYDLTLLDREMRRTGIGQVVTMSDGLVALSVGSGTCGQPFPVIDTLVVDKAIDRYRPGRRQLSFVAEHYGVPMADGAAHGATADVIASLRIAIEIANRCDVAANYVARNGEDPMVFRMHPFMQHYAGRRDPLEIVKTFAALGAMTLPELHERQVVWSAEQAMGLREHFMRHPEKGDAAGVTGEWPVRTVNVRDGRIETISTELV